MSREILNAYDAALRFAAYKHLGKTLKNGNLPYLVHIAGVCTEVLVAAQNTSNFNTVFAVQVALLHDTVEDTHTSIAELEEHFGKQVAEAVLALTKFDNLPSDMQLRDSIQRIRQQPHEVWAVKLADRINNLQPPPPEWTTEKIARYHGDAKIIYAELYNGNEFLAERLNEKIELYSKFIELIKD
jgi:guanosine-3',5'-bis(diphosphate) 3'-pyrophosphohydrolase